MNNNERMILLGEIGAAHGIRGEVSVRSYTAEPTDIARHGPLTDENGVGTYQISSVRVTPKGLLVRISGVEDRNAAERLRNTKLYVPRSRLPEPEAGAYYHEDLIGLQAVDTAGKTLGVVRSVANYGAGDLLEILLHDGSDTEFIPFTAVCVPQVDVAAGRLVIVPPQVISDDEPDDDEGVEPEQELKG